MSASRAEGFLVDYVFNANGFSASSVPKQSDGPKQIVSLVNIELIYEFLFN